MPMLSTNVDKKIIRNRVFNCHLSSDWRQMTIENTVSSIFFYLCSLIVMSVLIAAFLRKVAYWEGKSGQF